MSLLYYDFNIIYDILIFNYLHLVVLESKEENSNLKRQMKQVILQEYQFEENIILNFHFILFLIFLKLSLYWFYLDDLFISFQKVVVLLCSDKQNLIVNISLIYHHEKFKYQIYKVEYIKTVIHKARYLKPKYHYFQCRDFMNLFQVPYT